jgi:rhodanese-related sulfurtransferase
MLAVDFCPRGCYARAVNRRTLLATLGAGLAGGFAGCLSGSGGTPTGDETPVGPASGGGDTSSGGTAPLEHPGTLSTTFVANGDYPTDENPADGRPPEFADQPPSPEAEPSTFETLSVNDETVRLAPIDVVHRWYLRGEARIVDARGLEQYERAHVYGGVSSPAQPDSTGGGIEAWSREDRVVTYCGCPHHLSSIRAAGLQKAGFTEVYALDEGFLGRPDSWAEQEYPMAGTAFRSGSQANVQQWTVSGSVDSRYAGEFVWATVDRQYEAAPVRSDGTYELHLKFADVSSETPVEIRTPTDSFERPLGRVGSRSI